MTIIFSSKGSKVIKDQNGTYTLESNNSLLLSYLTRIIPNIVKGQSNSIVFETSSVMTLSQLLSHNKDGLSYEKTESMMRMIIKQVKFFESNNFGLLFVTPEDIITLDGEIFFIGNGDLFKQENSGILLVDAPYKKDEFKSPEFLSIRSLPYRISYKSGYYSVACIGIYCMFGLHIHEKTNVDAELLPITQTKLYWFFKRALQKNIKERFLILI